MTTPMNEKAAAVVVARLSGAEQRGDVTIARGGRRLAVVPSAWLTDWYVPYSPRNENNNAEGPWEDWVTLAHEILAVDALVKAQLSAPTADKAEHPVT